MAELLDSWQRQINYLRISVTDLCNLNCVYCNSGGVSHLRHEDILRFEEMERLVSAAARLGITKVRLTGGEPLARPQIVKLVRLISHIEGIDDISMTTNGVMLGRYAQELKDAGLDRVNISLDTFRQERFSAIARHDRLTEVLAGIEAAHRAGLEPVKINTVVMRGRNDDEVLDFARKTIHDGWNVRFIEFMPFEIGQQAPETVPTPELKKRISVLGELIPCKMNVGNGPARYFRLPSANGTIGFITPMSEHFCHECNRLRVTADGHLRPCLLADDEVDIKTALRSGAPDKEIEAIIRNAISLKRREHQLEGGLAADTVRRPMCQIGG